MAVLVVYFHNEITCFVCFCRGMIENANVCSITFRVLDYAKLMRKGLTTNPLGCQGNFDYRKFSLDYATLRHAFRNCFSVQKLFLCIHKYGDRENH